METSFLHQETATHYPDIYKVKFEHVNELITLYASILGDATCINVHEELAKYVTRNIEPVGWKAIWRPTARSAQGQYLGDIVVKVIDVTINKLEASVLCMKLLTKESQLTPEVLQNAKKMVEEKEIASVPLIDLFVIMEGDDSEAFLQTAEVIEHVRFFYTQLWRPWDDMLEDADTCFVDKLLEERVNFRFDVKNKLVPEPIVVRFKNLIRRAWELKRQWDQIRNLTSEKPEGETDSYDADDAIEENLFVQMMKIQLDLEDISREVKRLEDPYIRSIFWSLKRSEDVFDSPIKKKDAPENDIAHLVGNDLTIKSISNMLPSLKEIVGEDCEIRFHRNFEDAIISVETGEWIFLLPGVHRCGKSPFIEKDIKLRGLGKDRSEVVLESLSFIGDIFLNIQASNVSIENMTIRTNGRTDIMIMLHCGKTNIKNCELDGKSTKNAVYILPGAEFNMDSTVVRHGNKNSAIMSAPGSTVNLASSSVEEECTTPDLKENVDINRNYGDSSGDSLSANTVLLTENSNDLTNHSSKKMDVEIVY